VARAIEEANRKSVVTISFLGRDGGFTKGLSALEILVPGPSTARIQEAQKLLFHVLCEIVEERLPRAEPPARRGRRAAVRRESRTAAQSG